VTTAPNILLITTDQHRFDALGCMGSSEVLTPNIDRLATQGVLFERCYVTNPVCMPSRASFLTGQFPDAHGVRRNGIPVPDVQHGLARALGRLEEILNTVVVEELRSLEESRSKNESP